MTMTAEQEARCDALAKRIAVLDPNWAQEGMAIRDHITLLGFRWRANLAAWLPCAWSVERSIGSADITVRAKCKYARIVEARAIAAGPDYTDACTLGCLLLSLGDVSIWRYSARADALSEKWAVQPLVGAVPVSLGDSRAEAILAAKVEQLQQEAK